MRAIEFCIPSLAFIFGLLLTTHLVQPVQDWALGVEIFGSVLLRARATLEYLGTYSGVYLEKRNVPRQGLCKKKSRE